MNLQKEICAAFCDGLIVRKVPVGYSISTPVTWFNGETISFYARVEKHRARFEDSGALIFDLEGQGVDLSSGNRRQILDGLLAEHDVIFSDEDMLFCTQWVRTDKLAECAMRFLAFLSRIQDLLFLNHDIVKSTFKYTKYNIAIKKRATSIEVTPSLGGNGRLGY